MPKFDAQKNLYNIVESILEGAKPSQELLDEADYALKRLSARSGESIEEWAEKLAASFFVE